MGRGYVGMNLHGGGQIQALEGSQKFYSPMLNASTTFSKHTIDNAQGRVLVKPDIVERCERRTSEAPRTPGHSLLCSLPTQYDLCVERPCNADCYVALLLPHWVADVTKILFLRQVGETEAGHVPAER